MALIRSSTAEAPRASCRFLPMSLTGPAWRGFPWNRSSTFSEGKLQPCHRATEVFTRGARLPSWCGRRATSPLSSDRPEYPLHPDLAGLGSRGPDQGRVGVGGQGASRGNRGVRSHNMTLGRGRYLQSESSVGKCWNVRPDPNHVTPITTSGRAPGGRLRSAGRADRSGELETIARGQLAAFSSQPVCRASAAERVPRGAVRGTMTGP